MTDTPPAQLIDWRGNRWTPRPAKRPPRIPTAASPRRPRSAPAIDPDWENPERRAHLRVPVRRPPRHNTIPLVYQAFNWSSGVYTGATMGSETTAAAGRSRSGKVRRDPMAMLPFCGYHMGDYFRHWIKMQRSLSTTPRIFHVNWFRKDEEGRFLWPGYSENMRVLKWIVDRVRGRAQGKETAIGWTPYFEDIQWAGLDIPKPELRATFEQLQQVDPAAWKREVMHHEELFIDLHDHLPAEMIYERELLICRL